MQVLKTSGFIEVHGASPDRPFRGGRGQESTDDLKLCRVAASSNKQHQCAPVGRRTHFVRRCAGRYVLGEMLC